MSWSDNIDALSNALASDQVFGESVALPSGDVVSGVFVHTEGPQRVWGEAGQPRLGGYGRAAKPTPELHLRPVDAAALPHRAALTIRGVRYLVTKIDPPIDGLARVELMPDDERVEGTEGAVWR